MTDLNKSGEKSSGKTKNSRKKPHRQERVLHIVLWIVLGSLLAGTILSFARYQKQLSSLSLGTGSDALYNRHFSFVGDRTRPFQSAVYNAALSEAETYGDYIEFTGESLDTTYSLAELMAIASASAPDGIIVNATDNDEMESAINEAAGDGIPIICIGTDIYGSARQSYVGISYYTLGQTYGQCLLPLYDKTALDVLVIGSLEDHATGQNLVISGLQDYLMQHGASSWFNMTSQTVGDGKSFSVAEAVSDLFLSGDLPDVLICLDETTTTCACQAVVDSNHVGEVAIYGYYMNDSILDAIQKEVISGTLTVSTQEIGKTAVDNLEEYLSTGFTSEYSAIGIETVTPDNAEEFIEEEEAAE